MDSNKKIVNDYLHWIGMKEYPCIGAKAALGLAHIRVMVADHMACPADDGQVLKFLYDFVDEYRNSSGPYHSAAVIFKHPAVEDETVFDQLFWQRLKSLAALDRKTYTCDNRVDPDPLSPHFSFSLKEEAFFIIGIHPASGRPSRRFLYPTIVFNPHAEFEKLRKARRYEPMKQIVRKRDIEFSGSINPTLTDFGEASEVYQYSGVQHPPGWKCPLADNNEPGA